MNINDMHVVSVSERSSNEVEIVVQCSLSEALSLDGQTLSIKDDSGKDWKVYSGYSCTGVMLDEFDETLVHAVFARALDPQIESAISGIEANVSILHAALESGDASLQSQLDALAGLS